MSEQSYDASYLESKAKVLIVDDEIEITEEITETLEVLGYECIAATDPYLGLEIVLMDTEISIVIVDVRMPGMNGIELCKKIKVGLAADRDVEIIVVTGHAGLTEAIESVRVGVLDFLKKPITIELLQHTVGKANQKINDSQLKREFHEMLKSEVARKTQEIQQKSIELEASNIKLMLSNQVKSEFLRMMNHELRTPLHQIIGLSDFLESQLENKQQSNLLDMIKISGEHLTDMITSILDMIAIETDSLQLRRSETNMDQLIENTVNVYQDMADKAKITIDTKHVQPVSASIDSLRISQAIGRLIDNAISFSSPGGVVELSANQEGDNLVISIKDHGSGMTEQGLKKLDSPLTQVDGEYTKEHEGIGLGFSLAKMFTECHGGELSVTSVPNEGTLVKLILPSL